VAAVETPLLPPPGPWEFRLLFGDVVYEGSGGWYDCFGSDGDTFAGCGRDGFPSPSLSIIGIGPGGEGGGGGASCDPGCCCGCCCGGGGAAPSFAAVSMGEY